MELAVFLFTYFFLGIPGTYWVIIYVVGKIFSRRIQRRWNREKRFRIDGAIPEISFTNLSLRGGMKSEPLTKPSGSLCGDEQLLWMSLKILEQGERRFLLESNSEVQKKPGHHEAGSCFPHISSSILWILAKLGTYGKLISRGIQRHRLREIWRRTRRRRRVLPEINSVV